MPLLSPGFVHFRVLELKHHTSHAGKTMVKLVLVVKSGMESNLVYDYLLPNPDIKGRNKRRVEDFHHAIGLEVNPDFFNLPDFDAYNGLEGRAEIRVEKGQQKKDQEVFWPDQNKVENFLSPEFKEPKPRPAPIDTRFNEASPPPDDLSDLPF